MISKSRVSAIFQRVRWGIDNMVDYVGRYAKREGPEDDGEEDDESSEDGVRSCLVLPSSLLHTDDVTLIG